MREHGAKARRTLSDEDLLLSGTGRAPTARMKAKLHPESRCLALSGWFSFPGFLKANWQRWPTPGGFVFEPRFASRQQEDNWAGSPG